MISWILKEEAVDHTLWRTSCGEGSLPVVTGYMIMMMMVMMVMMIPEKYCRFKYKKYYTFLHFFTLKNFQVIQEEEVRRFM
jgi:hypothetical protein